MTFWILIILANLWLCTAYIQGTIREKEGTFSFAMGIIWMLLAVFIGASDSGEVLEVRCLPEVVAEQVVEK